MDRPLTLGERAADFIAAAGRSWAFLFILNGAMAAYMVFQYVLGRNAFDPYPYILLNLGLSWMAAIQAPVIMMSQGRQDDIQRETLRAILVLLKSAEERIQDDMRERKDEIDDMKKKT